MLQELAPLHCAARDYNLEMTKTLLACGLDNNARTLLVSDARVQAASMLQVASFL